MSYIMKGEDDVLENRRCSNNSTMGSERSISVISTRSFLSNKSKSARLLSEATSQATSAARSILESGGTEDTAIRTAKAAAQAILLASHEGQLNGPKGFVTKRNIKKQAEVIASMALVHASDSMGDHHWEHLQSTKNGDQATRSWKNSLETPKFGSHLSKKHGVVESPKQSPISPKSKVKEPTNDRTVGATKTNEIKPVVKAERSTPLPEPSDPEIARPVAIRVETRTKVKKSQNSSQQHSTPHSRTSKGKDNKESTPSKRNAIGGSLPIEIVCSDVGDTKVDKDPADRQREASSAPSAETSNTAQPREIPASDSAGSTPGFMERTVDPYIFRFTDVFRCMPSSSSPTRQSVMDDNVAQLVLMDSLADTHNLSARTSDDVGNQSVSSSSSSEDEDVEPFFSTGEDSQGHVLSSPEGSYITEESERRAPRTTKQSLRQKMRNIISKSKAQSSSRHVVQNRSSMSSSFSSEGREEYSSDSRDEIDSGDSYDSSDSSETEESRQRISSSRKGRNSGGSGGFVWKGRRQRLRKTSAEDAYMI